MSQHKNTLGKLLVWMLPLVAAQGVLTAHQPHDALLLAAVSPNFANDKMINSLFHNKGRAVFEEIAIQAGVALPENGAEISGMGVDFRDSNNDGYPDISVVALRSESFPLFQNAGNGTFIDDTEKSGMVLQSTTMSGYSPNFADFDNDGWQDLLFFAKAGENDHA